MSRPVFYFIEPSKVRQYHITLIEGYLDALQASSVIADTMTLVLCASQSTFENLSAGTRSRVRYEAIAVIDQDKHHIVRKSLLEFWVVLTYMLRARSDDVLFVSCIMPTALLMLELVNRLLQRRNLFVVVHGEIEALFTTDRLGRASIGYWTRQWLRVRGRNSRVKIIGIDRFIKAALIRAFPDRFSAQSVFVAHHPISTAGGIERGPSSDRTACFIGYRSPAKGFDDFVRLARSRLTLRFLAIGAGKIEDVRTGATTPIAGSAGFLQAVSDCAIAIFPYRAAYDCSLSAAVLDALSTGVHVVATPRASFVSLAEQLGPSFVTIYRSPDELDALLSTPGWIEQKRIGREQRLKELSASSYSLASVGRDFVEIVNALSRHRGIA